MRSLGNKLYGILAVVLVAGCGASNPNASGSSLDAGSLAHSSSIVLSADGSTLYVADPDADAVSVLSVKGRSLTREIALSKAPPAVDANGDFTPAVMPRELALSPDGRTLFVTGRRSGKLYAVDLESFSVAGSVAVGSEPMGVVVSPDGKAVFVACSEDGTVVRVDSRTFSVTSSADVGAKPWALALASGGSRLLVSHFLSGEVSVLGASHLSVLGTWNVPDESPRGDRRLAHGHVRGTYDLAVRPGSDEVWVAHTLLGTDTPQPQLDFESTAFPALSVLNDAGAFRFTLSTDAPDVPGIDGAFTDVVSGPHALAFTSDGAFAFLVDTGSEDVLAVDAEQHVETTLLRPLPGHMPEGLALSADGRFLYVDERNTADVAVVRVDRSAGGVSLELDGSPIQTLTKDPMPATLRLGQHLFYSSNSDEYPVTQNHWVSCASCHMEGRSDAVTWLFAQGPRDTPSNAGGTLATGFLFRTADRNKIQDYWKTFNVEQGGQFDPTDPAQAKLLDALADYVNHAIPLPVPPKTDPTLVAEGKKIFNRADVGCASCHRGAHFTDSGYGNPTLDLTGPLMLHDVGTCVKSGPFPDVAHDDIDGDPRAACQFDTPSLNGLADSAPYLHDGSAPTLMDVLERTRGRMGDISSLSSDQLNALVEYLKSL
jgi:YVTN family beta-propeller protein